MSTNRSIAVENWGETTLKKLQNLYFESKHYDFELHFHGNQILHVHRLILRLHTDYFERLEDECGGTGFCIMPRTLQTNVMLPIITFFYTGRIEFENCSLNQLLRAVKKMHVPILINLLEMHRSFVEVRKSNNKRKLPTLPVKENEIKILNGKLNQIQEAKTKLERMPITVRQRKSKQSMDNETNGSSLSKLLTLAMANGESIDGPSRYKPDTKPASPFGDISYNCLVENINERVLCEAKKNELINDDENDQPNYRLEEITPRKSIQDYIDFPEDPTRTFLSFDENDASPDETHDLSSIDVSSDLDVFEAFELDE